MSNNFLGLDNSKNSELMFNLLRLNLLGAPGGAAAFTQADKQSLFQAVGLTAPPKPITGRPITNTANLAGGVNHMNAGDLFPSVNGQNGTTGGGGMIGGGMNGAGIGCNDLNDFKTLLHMNSTDNGMSNHQKSYRNGADENNRKTQSNIKRTYQDFNDYMARDSFLNSLQSQSSGGGVGNNMNNSVNNGFPTIDTFTIESTTSSSNHQQQQQQQQQIFSQPSFFNSSSTNNNAINGTNSSTFNSNNNTGNNLSGSSNSDPNQATRETGIIEKLLHSYGFIQCCERQARLFFHFSQFSGTIEHLKIGDPVEFEMTYDRRTGKPIASQVSKIAPEVVLSEERVTGTVTTELKSETTGIEITTGRISYENRGECFFLPYTKDDVEGNVSLHSGDKVSFQIATNQRGNLGACHIRLENPAHPVLYRGVVCSMKESFGFIERADVVKEIFFHFSEADGTVELRPGDDVEFIIQTRNGKEVACNISRLPPGSVIFEDIGTTVYKGQVLKSLDRANPLRHNNDPLPGRIRYRATDHSEVEVPFGDKDQKGDFTLRHGDWVQFLLATDRRDQLQRATLISLLDETFDVSGERREQGVVAALKEGFGFLRCVERNVRLFFHFTEVLDTAREICVGDEVEFTTMQEPGSSFGNTRLSAIRIKHLPPGKVQFETLMENSIEGIVTREAPKSPTKSQERMEGGVITYTQANNKKTIMYFLKDCDKPPRVGDHVRFDICEVKRNKELIAVNIVEISNHAIQNQLSNSNNPIQISPNSGEDAISSMNMNVELQRTNSISNRNGIIVSPQKSDVINNANNTINTTNSINSNNSASGTGTGTGTGNGKSSIVYFGFIAVLKENFGFIETINHDEEVFFHFSNFVGNPNNLELGQEVEYTLSKRNGSNAGNCLPAEFVKVVSKGTINQPPIIDAQYNGVVARPLRCINPDQQEYCGLIEQIDENGTVLSTHELGITSLVNKRDLLQSGDHVVFKVDKAGRAADVKAIRQKKRATVDSIKGQFGFLDYEVEEGKKLFFHMSEVQSFANNLYPGDSVEFSVVTNQRNGKSSACNVIKVSDSLSSVRPERLLSRLKMNSFDDSIPRLIVIRAPKGPDGKGFSISARVCRKPGVLID